MAYLKLCLVQLFGYYEMCEKDCINESSVCALYLLFYKSKNLIILLRNKSSKNVELSGNKPVLNAFVTEGA
jgi:hypothetical protein